MVEPLGANIARYANDCERLQVAVHIREVDHLPDRVLARPALEREGLADHRNMWRIHVILSAKEPPAHQRNAQRPKIAFARDAIQRRSYLRGIFGELSPFVEV